MLNRATIPTYTFINSNAGSAGALVALTTQHIYMAPVSAIGAAAPVLSTGEDLPLTQCEKTISYWSALIRSSARNRQVCPADSICPAFENQEGCIFLLLHRRKGLRHYSGFESVLLQEKS